MIIWNWCDQSLGYSLRPRRRCLGSIGILMPCSWTRRVIIVRRYSSRPGRRARPVLCLIQTGTRGINLEIVRLIDLEIVLILPIVDTRRLNIWIEFNWLGVVWLCCMAYLLGWRSVDGRYHVNLLVRRGFLDTEKLQL